MMLWRMLLSEICHRKLGSVLGLLAVVIAVGALVGTLTMLKIHDAHTSHILKQKEAETQERLAALANEMRKATLKLSFNLLILPKDQNLQEWHLKDYASTYMPEEYVMRLADSGIVLVRHFLPVLQEKVKWPERKRTIILVGARGEVPNLHKNPRKPLVQPVPPGAIVLGYALHQSLGLKVGDEVCLMDKELTVHKCHEQRGSRDDITAWISLGEAQKLLNREGFINAILALECLCAGRMDIGKLRAEIMKILPGTQVLEMGSKKLARQEARMRLKEETKQLVEREKQHRAGLKREWESFSAIFVPVVMVASMVWIALLGFGNVRDRRREIGILRAIGFRSRQIMSLFLLKSFALGLLGGALGFALGLASGNHLAGVLEANVEDNGVMSQLFDPRLLLITLVIASALSVMAGWIPAMLAAQEDPAEILRKE